jgi:hypothetical protein
MGMPDGRDPSQPAGSVQEDEPMQILRASLVALPFVILAILVGALSVLIGPLP